MCPLRGLTPRPGWHTRVARPPECAGRMHLLPGLPPGPAETPAARQQLKASFLIDNPSRSTRESRLKADISGATARRTGSTSRPRRRPEKGAPHGNATAAHHCAVLDCLARRPLHRGGGNKISVCLSKRSPSVHVLLDDPFGAHMQVRLGAVLGCELLRQLLVLFLDDPAMRHVARKRVLEPHHCSAVIEQGGLPCTRTQNTRTQKSSLLAPLALRGHAWR